MLLLLAPTHDSRAVAEALADADLGQLAAMMAEERLLGLLGRRLIDAHGGEVEADFIAAVETARRAGEQRAMVQQLYTQRLLEAVETCGVRIMPLKGGFWAQWLHGSPGMRLSGDIDVLVAREQMSDALDVFQTLGYGRPGPAAALPKLHYGLESGSGLPELELHWRLHWYEERFAIDMLERSTLSEPHVRRPDPLDELIALAIFFARDGFLELRHAVDLATWWENNEPDLRPTDLQGRLRATPELTATVLAALHVMFRIQGRPSPEVIPAFTHWRWRRAVALGVAAASSSGRGGRDHLVAIDGMLVPRHQFPDFVRRRFLMIPSGPESRLRSNSRAAFGAVRAALRPR